MTSPLQRLWPYFPVVVLAMLPPRSSRSAEPHCEPNPPPPLQPGDLDVWPVFERLGFDMVNDVPIYGEERPGIWNSFGEYQNGDYVHTGIDINGEHQGSVGDFIRVVADGNLWATHYFVSDACTHISYCKVYVKSADLRYIYYYAHLNIREGADGDMDSQVREKIEAAAMHDNPNEPPAPDTEVAKGDLLAGMASFVNQFSHLHLSILDTCENYDGLSPLDFLVSPHKDENDPVIEDVDFVDSGVELLPGNPTCDVLGGNVDVIARMRDVWDDSGEWVGNEDLGVHRAELRVQRLPSVNPVTPQTWHHFDNIPFRCRGPEQGEACTLGVDPVAQNKVLIDQPEFVQLMGLSFPSQEETGGPYLATNYTHILYGTTPPYDSCSNDYYNVCVPPPYFHILNNSWGLDAEGGFGGPIDTSALASGLYQFSVEAQDHAGNATVAHRFAVVDNGGQPVLGDLLIRDHPEDVGAIPSNLGGHKFYRSPDIKVAANQPAANDPIWDTVQSINVDEGVLTKLWVRVVNHGCEPITGFSVSVADADYALIADDWQYVDQLDPQKEFPNTTLDPGEAIVVGFDWIPEVDGHRCLLAAVNSTADPTIVPLDQNDLMDFDQLVGPDKAFTPLDNNLAQRNIKVADTDDDPGAIGNPFGETIALGVGFDCNEFPIFEAGASAKLVVEDHPALATAWNGVPGTTLVDTGTQLELTFHTCEVRLPDAIMPPFTELAADMVLVLPSATFGTFVVDLTAYVNGLEHGGASFFVQQLGPPPG